MGKQGLGDAGPLPPGHAPALQPSAAPPSPPVCLPLMWLMKLGEKTNCKALEGKRCSWHSDIRMLTVASGATPASRARILSRQGMNCCSRGR